MFRPLATAEIGSLSATAVKKGRGFALAAGTGGCVGPYTRPAANFFPKIPPTYRAPFRAP